MRRSLSVTYSPEIVCDLNFKPFCAECKAMMFVDHAVLNRLNHFLVYQLLEEAVWSQKMRCPNYTDTHTLPILCFDSTMCALLGSNRNDNYKAKGLRELYEKYIKTPLGGTQTNGKHLPLPSPLFVKE